MIFKISFAFALSLFLIGPSASDFDVSHNFFVWKYSVFDFGQISWLESELVDERP